LNKSTEWDRGRHGGGMRKIYKTVVRKPDKRGHFGILGLNGMIKLKLILKHMWTGFNWLTRRRAPD
jgi:hypothetical protein